jgi:CopG antitoxin of type II toxin-antitoxin system
MSGNRTPISGGRSYREIGEYWDTHDASDLMDESREVEFEVDIKSKTHYYPVEQTLSRRIEHLAHERGVSAETLVNLWIQEKLADSGS